MIFLPEFYRLQLAVLSHSSGPVLTSLFHLLNQACTSGVLFVCFAPLNFSNKPRELLVIVLESLGYVVLRSLNQACISGMFIVCFALLTTFSKLLEVLVIVLEPLGFVKSFKTAPDAHRKISSSPALYEFPTSSFLQSSVYLSKVLCMLRAF